MLLNLFLFMFFCIIDNDTWLDKPEFSKFGNILANILIDIGDILLIIILIPFVLLELIFGTIIWLIQCAFYKKSYRKSFAQFFKLVDNNMELKQNGKDYYEE